MNFSFLGSERNATIDLFACYKHLYRLTDNSFSSLLFLMVPEQRRQVSW